MSPANHLPSLAHELLDNQAKQRVCIAAAKAHARLVSMGGLDDAEERDCSLFRRRIIEQETKKTSLTQVTRGELNAVLAAFEAYQGPEQAASAFDRRLASGAAAYDHATAWKLLCDHRRLFGWRGDLATLASRQAMDAIRRDLRLGQDQFSAIVGKSDGWLAEVAKRKFRLRSRPPFDQLQHLLSTAQLQQLLFTLRTCRATKTKS